MIRATFDNVQRIRSNVRRYPDGWGDAHPLTGLMYCADCGGKMYVHRTNNGKRIAQYTCAEHSKVPVGVRCSTQHRIKADTITEIGLLKRNLCIAQACLLMASLFNLLKK